MTTTKANDVQIGGDHYKKGRIQPWDYILANDIGYLEGTAIKYLTRWKYKNGVEDLKKARHFIDKAIEHYYSQEANQVILFDKEEGCDPAKVVESNPAMEYALWRKQRKEGE
jgi:Protein of unknwon function (DUF3310)